MAKKEKLEPIDIPITKFKRCANCLGIVVNDEVEDMLADDEELLYCSQDCFDEATYNAEEHYEEECEQGAWTTTDGCKYYQHGKLLLDTTDMEAEEASEAAGLIMEQQQFWPNVFYVSDHGNVSLTQVT